MLPTRVLKSLNRAVPQLFAYVTVPNLAKITYYCVSPYLIKRNFKLDISFPYTTDKSIYRTVTDLLYLLHVCYMSVTCLLHVCYSALTYLGQINRVVTDLLHTYLS